MVNVSLLYTTGGRALEYTHIKPDLALVEIVEYRVYV